MDGIENISVSTNDLIEIRNLLMPILNCKIFCAESADIDNYAESDLYLAIDKLNSLINN